jgi:hypothetical protein
MRLDTDLEALRKAIKKELLGTEGLKLVSELKTDVNDRPFWSITAVRQNIPRSFVGALREATVTITGEPDDFLVEVHTGAWFRNLAMPGTAGFVIAGPLGGLVGASASSIVAVDYQMKLWKRIRELVKQYSKKELSLERVQSFPYP